MADLSKKQQKRLKRAKEKEVQKEVSQKKRFIKRTKKIILTVIIVFSVGFGIYYFASNVKLMPPISSQAHSEDVPQTNILTEEMPDRTQRHMLEHAGGAGPSGFIIQYNCVKFQCEDDLVENLAKIAKQFPNLVYLAPTSIYDGKIILTTLGKMDVLEEFNEERIMNFISK